MQNMEVYSLEAKGQVKMLTHLFVCCCNSMLLSFFASSKVFPNGGPKFAIRLQGDRWRGDEQEETATGYKRMLSSIFLV